MRRHQVPRHRAGRGRAQGGRGPRRRGRWRDGAAALRAAIAQIIDQRPRQSARINAPMRVKTPILNGDKGLPHMRGQFAYFDWVANICAIAGNWLPVCCQQGQLWRGNGL